MTSTTAKPAITGADPNRSIRNAGLTAGIALLLLAALSAFGFLVVVQGLVTPGDPAQTAKDITESSGLFRLGIASLYLVIPLDIVVGWAMYRVFSPVNKSLSMLAACLRIAFAVVFMVAISQLVGALRLLDNDAYVAAVSPDQLHAQVLLTINAFSDVWHAGLLLFGLHLLIVGYLAFKSGYVPRLIAVLVVIDGLSYAVDTFGTVFSPGTWTDTATFTFIGELLLGLWLVIRGRRLTVKESAADTTSDRITAAQ
ncbi:MAG TPA: DUF4386 domain-containing protein [Microlunatus sp.]